jgi:hypothetical protein
MLPIIRIRHLIPQYSCLFHSFLLSIKLHVPQTNRLNRYRAFFVDQLIDGRFYDVCRPLLSRFMVGLQPRA